MEGSTSRNEVIDITTHEQKRMHELLATVAHSLRRRRDFLAVVITQEWPDEAYQPIKAETDDTYLQGMFKGLELAAEIVAEWQPNQA